MSNENNMNNSEQEFQNWLEANPQPRMQPVSVSRLQWEESKKRDREANAARAWVKNRTHGEG
jgi:hypothetical protein